MMWAAVALALAACARDHAHGVSRMPPVGSIAVLGVGAAHGEQIGEPCLPTRAELDAVLRAKATRSGRDAHVSDYAIPLAPRLRVRILSRADGDRAVRLRLLDGFWAGTACWVDGGLEDLFASK